MCSQPRRNPIASRDKSGAFDPETLKTLVEQSLDADKAENIVTISLQDKSSLADYIMIATVRSSRHAASLAKKLEGKLKAAGAKSVHIEGMTQGDWVLIDAGDVIIHLFRQEVRDFYRIEEIWGMDLPSTENMVYLSA